MGETQKKTIYVPRSTNIYHRGRLKLGLDLYEYTIADAIHKLCLSSNNRRNPGWCKGGITYMANFIGMSRQGIYDVLERLISKGIVEKDIFGKIRCTDIFINTVEMSKQEYVTEKETPERKRVNELINRSLTEAKQKCQETGQSEESVKLVDSSVKKLDSGTVKELDENRQETGHNTIYNNIPNINSGTEDGKEVYVPKYYDNVKKGYPGKMEGEAGKLIYYKLIRDEEMEKRFCAAVVNYANSREVGQGYKMKFSNFVKDWEKWLDE